MGPFPEPVTRVAAIGSSPMAAFLAGGLVILLLFRGRGHVRRLAVRQRGRMLGVRGPGLRRRALSEKSEGSGYASVIAARGSVSERMHGLRRRNAACGCGRDLQFA